MKKSNSLPIYILSAAILFLGISSATTANSAPAKYPSLKQFNELKESIWDLQDRMDVVTNRVGDLEKPSPIDATKTANLRKEVDSLNKFMSCAKDAFFALYMKNNLAYTCG